MFPILFSIGPLSIHSLSVCIVVAWLVFSFVFWKYLRERGVLEERIFDIPFVGTIWGFIAARLGYVAIHWDLFSDTWLKIPALWVVPGLSFYVGLIGGIVAMLFVRTREIKIGTLFDGISLAILCALPIGFGGAFLDGSYIGRPTSLPWGIVSVGTIETRHPVALYYIIAVVVLIVLAKVLLRIAKRTKWPEGLFTAWISMLIGLVGTVLEFFHDMPVYPWGVHIVQLFYLVLLCEGVGFILVKHRIGDVIRAKFTRTERSSHGTSIKSSAESNTNNT